MIRKILNLSLKLLNIVKNSNFVTKYIIKAGDGHPIPSELINRVDAIRVMKSGDLNLMIVSSGYLDDSDYTSERIVDKLNAYLDYINSQSFYKEFGDYTSRNVSITLSCSEQPHDYIFELIYNISEGIKAKTGISLSLEIK